jgi:MarR family 2-MHQ and catechol resistance regulon transcriptional repressor
MTVGERENSGGRRQPAVFAWMRLARVYHKIDRATAVGLRAHDLSVAQFDVLARVGGSEGLTQSELAQALLVTKGNVCQLLDRMEARGLIERRPVLAGRGNQIYLTARGRCLHDAVVPSQEAFVANQFAALSAAEREQLHQLLRKLDRSLDHQEE